MYKEYNKITMDTSEEFAEKFLQKPLLFRIEAAVHDGQWVTPQKWATYSETTIDEINKFIKNCDYLIEENGSYRVSAEEIYRWYKKNGIDIFTPVVPNLFTPRIWGDKTEVDIFRSVPKRPVQSIIVDSNYSTILDKVVEAADGKGIVVKERGTKYYIYTTSAHYIVYSIQKMLSDYEKTKVSFRIRKPFMWREIAGLPNDYLLESISFYCSLAKGLLRNRMSTLSAFLPTQEDIDGQIYDWIIRAMQKYDEKSNVPFSGYLASVLQRWPYSLGDIHLGRKLADFQRDLARAKNAEITDLRSFMLSKYPEYDRLKEELDAWIKFTDTLSSVVGEKDIERVEFSVHPDVDKKRALEDLSIKHKLSKAILQAFIQTRDEKSFTKALAYLKNPSDAISISEEFKNALERILKL